MGASARPITNLEDIIIITRHAATNVVLVRMRQGNLELFSLSAKLAKRRGGGRGIGDL